MRLYRALRGYSFSSRGFLRGPDVAIITGRAPPSHEPKCNTPRRVESWYTFNLVDDLTCGLEVPSSASKAQIPSGITRLVMFRIIPCSADNATLPPRGCGVLYVILILRKYLFIGTDCMLQQGIESETTHTDNVLLL